MNRRLFLKWIPAIAGVSIFTPKRFIHDLFTTPIIGENYSRLTESEIIAKELERVRDAIPSLFERDNVFFTAIEKGSQFNLVRDMRIPLQLEEVPYIMKRRIVKL